MAGGDGGRVTFIYHQIKSAGVTDFVDSGMGGITDSILNQVANETSPCHLDFCNFFIAMSCNDQRIYSS